MGQKIMKSEVEDMIFLATDSQNDHTNTQTSDTTEEINIIK